MRFVDIYRLTFGVVILLTVIIFLFCRNVECLNLLLNSGAELDSKDNLGR